MTEDDCEQTDGFEREELVQAVQSREHFLSGVLGSLQSFATIDEDWRFTFVNEAAARFAETSAAELVGKDLRQLPEAARFPEVMALLERAMSENVHVEFDLADPSWRHSYRGAADPLKGGGLAIYVRDVTERKRLEEELSRRQEELSHLIRHAATAIYELDFRGPRFVSVNDFMCTYSGYSREELLAMSPLDLLDEESQIRFRERSAKVLSGEPVDAQVEYCFLMKQGEKRCAVLNITPTFQADRPVGAFVVGQDVTERKRAEEALRESEDRLLRIAKTGRTGFIEWNAATDVAYWSPEHNELFGIAPGSPVNWRRWLEGVHPEDRERVEANAAQLLERAGAEGEMRGHGDEFRYVRPDGSVVWIEADMSVDMIDGQAVVRGVLRDVTDRRQAEEGLRESEAQRVAQEERARIARDLHDSVTQSLFAATLKAEALTVASGEEAPATTAAAEEVRRLSRGALAQMRALLQELRGDPLEDVPLEQLLRNVVESAESRASVQVVLTLKDGGPLPAKVHEVIYRITQEALNNVVQHARAANAWVQLDADRSHVRLVIRDDGRGFDPQTVDQSHLGLTSMKERAFLAGADLLIQSAPGAGTVIQVDWVANRTSRSRSSPS